MGGKTEPGQIELWHKNGNWNHKINLTYLIWMLSTKRTRKTHTSNSLSSSNCSLAASSFLLFFLGRFFYQQKSTRYYNQIDCLCERIKRYRDHMQDNKYLTLSFSLFLHLKVFRLLGTNNLIPRTFSVFQRFLSKEFRCLVNIQWPNIFTQDFLEWEKKVSH